MYFRLLATATSFLILAAGPKPASAAAPERCKDPSLADYNHDWDAFGRAVDVYGACVDAEIKEHRERDELAERKRAIAAETRALVGDAMAAGPTAAAKRSVNRTLGMKVLDDTAPGKVLIGVAAGHERHFGVGEQGRSIGLQGGDGSAADRVAAALVDKAVMSQRDRFVQQVTSTNFRSASNAGIAARQSLNAADSGWRTSGSGSIPSSPLGGLMTTSTAALGGLSSDTSLNSNVARMTAAVEAAQQQAARERRERARAAQAARIMELYQDRKREMEIDRAVRTYRSAPTYHPSTGSTLAPQSPGTGYSPPSSQSYQDQACDHQMTPDGHESFSICPTKPSTGVR